MWELACGRAGIHDTSEMGLMARSQSYSVQVDSPTCSTEGAEPIDEDYLSLRWSNTAKFLREFRQRKDAQAEEIRRHRASLQALSADKALETTSTAQSVPVSPLGVLEKDVLTPSDSRLQWQDTASDQVALPLVTAPRLRPSVTRGHGALQPTWSNSGDGPAASTSSLDVLLQSVLQRSSAVSTKLTKTYAQAKLEEKESAPEPLRGSHTSLKKLPTHARFDRGRSQSRIHKQHTIRHHDEASGREPSPHAPTQQQQQSRPQAAAAPLSPVGSRSTSPTGLGPRESSVRSSLSQQASSALVGIAQPEKPETAAAEGTLPRDREPQLQSRAVPAEGSEQQQRQQQQQQSSSVSESGEQNQQQRRRSARPLALRHHRASSGGLSKRRKPLDRRAMSQSLDGGGGQPERGPAEPYFLAAEGDTDGMPHILALGSHSVQRVVSGSSVRLPRLGQAELKSGGGAPVSGGGSSGAGAGSSGGGNGTGSGGGSGAGNSGGGGGSSKSFEGVLSASGSSNGSSGEGPFRGAASASRRRAAAFRVPHLTDSGPQRSGSTSLWPTSPSAQSPWAKSTTARELVFTQF